jgi:hypothetical protein
MPPSDSHAQSLQSAIPLLRQFIRAEKENGALPDLDFAQVRQALLQVVEHSDYQIFGICADSATQAVRALESYLIALGNGSLPDLPPLPDSPIYLKFNPKSGRLHTDTYAGEHRGVLVSCQSAYDGDVNETFGHLPLNLFGGGEE